MTALTAVNVSSQNVTAFHICRHLLYCQIPAFGPPRQIKLVRLELYVDSIQLQNKFNIIKNHEHQNYHCVSIAHAVSFIS